MTPFAIRRTLRRHAADGLRALAEAVRPEEGAWDLSEAVDAPASPPPEAESAASEMPEHLVEAMASSASAPGGDDAAMALMAGLSGDMGPAISSRVREQRDQREADAASGGETFDQIVAALQTIYDPEIPVDIYQLGLIYEVDVREDTTVGVQMTLTSPNCPAAQSLPAEVQSKVASVPGVSRADVDVVFEPPWTPDLMSDEAKLELNIL